LVAALGSAIRVTSVKIPYPEAELGRARARLLGRGRHRRRARGNVASVLAIDAVMAFWLEAVGSHSFLDTGRPDVFGKIRDAIDLTSTKLREVACDHLSCEPRRGATGFREAASAVTLEGGLARVAGPGLGVRSGSPRHLAGQSRA
jgi:hypothetical protein